MPHKTEGVTEMWSALMVIGLHWGMCAAYLISQKVAQRNIKASNLSCYWVYSDLSGSFRSNILFKPSYACHCNLLLGSKVMTAPTILAYSLGHHTPLYVYITSMGSKHTFDGIGGKDVSAFPNRVLMAHTEWLRNWRIFIVYRRFWRPVVAWWL